MKLVVYFRAESMDDIESEINKYLEDRDKSHREDPKAYKGYDVPDMLDVKFIWDGDCYCALITMNNQESNDKQAYQYEISRN